MTASEYLYLVPEDLYRLAGFTGSKLTNVRIENGKDVDTYEVNGVTMVSSNGRGISLISEERLKRELLKPRNKGSYVWRVSANFALPPGLALQPDTLGLRAGEKPNHYLLCPQFDMTIGEYAGHLEKMALWLERVMKI